jgi:hypothetical protein
MKFSCSSNMDVLVGQIERALDAQLAGQRYAYGLRALNTLEAKPELALQGRIHTLLVDMLGFSDGIGYRNLAARILYDLGDPLGILHLTYNCLSEHPVIGQLQIGGSGCSDAYLIRRASTITDECIDLLVEDVCRAPGYLHADALAIAPADKVIPRMLPLLEMPIHISAQAAYVLAMHKNDKGRAQLEQIAEDVNLRLIELAIIGLSHIPNKYAIDLIKGYADGNHPVYLKDDLEFTLEQLTKKELLTKSRQRSRILERGESVSFVDVMKEFYATSPQQKFELQGVKLPDSFSPILLLDKLVYFTHAPDFVAEFATSSDRNALAEIQKVGMRQLLEVAPSDMLAIETSCNWPRFMLWYNRPRDTRTFGMPNFFFLEGVQILNDAEDYLFAATDWLLNPEDYRQGSHRRLTVGLEQSKVRGN